mmetsp:Transcript_15454/g.23333  ORF Transcript_15454/g.23333 Transcript_15454/m.23333 type:complete len:247 (-) Transcript_15454:702-1442(-)
MHGIGVLRGISTDIAWPSNSIPRDSGATSKSTRSVHTPCNACPPPEPPACNMAPCTAAPYATASSGLMDLQRETLPLKCCTSISCRAGMRVDPPTNTTSLTSSSVACASLSTSFTVSIHLVKSSEQSDSNSGFVSVALNASDPSIRASISISASAALERERLAASQAFLSLCIALALDRIAFIEFLPWRSSIVRRHQSKRALSKSSPPRWVSPPVALTVNTPPSIDKTLTSKVPPPRSNIITLDLF